MQHYVVILNTKRYVVILNVVKDPCIASLLLFLSVLKFSLPTKSDLAFSFFDRGNPGLPFR